MYSPIARRSDACPTKIVFSKTLKSAPWGKWDNATVVKGSASTEVAKLRASSGKGMRERMKMAREVQSSLMNNPDGLARQKVGTGKRLTIVMLGICAVVFAAGLFSTTTLTLNVVLSLFLMKIAPREARPPSRPWDDLKQGFFYVISPQGPGWVSLYWLEFP